MHFFDHSKIRQSIKIDSKIKQNCKSLFGLTVADSGNSKSTPMSIVWASSKPYKNTSFGSFSLSSRASRETICSWNRFARNVSCIFNFSNPGCSVACFFGRGSHGHFLHTSSVFLTKMQFKQPKHQYFAWRVAKIKALGRLQKMTLKMRFCINTLLL